MILYHNKEILIICALNISYLSATETIISKSTNYIKFPIYSIHFSHFLVKTKGGCDCECLPQQYAFKHWGPFVPHSEQSGWWNSS